jgi:transposase-like protein
MPQVQLPLFPVGTTVINAELAFERRDDQVVYLNGHLPVFTHRPDDLASFRFFTTQLIVNGTATQGQIAKAFGVSLTTVKRYCRAYRARGANAFFVPAARREGARLTAERLVEVQRLLDQGQRVPQISAHLNLLPSTLHKALDDGRLRAPKKSRGPGDRRGVAPGGGDQESAQRAGSAGRVGRGHDAVGRAGGRLAGPGGRGPDPI